MAQSFIDTLLGTAKDLLADPHSTTIKEYSGGKIDSVADFMRKTEHTGQKNYGRGFLAGILGGMAGVAVKMIVDHYAAPGVEQVEDEVSENIVDAAEAATGIKLSVDNQEVAESVVEMGIGMLIGGVYGLIVEAMPEAKTELSSEQGGGVFATAQQLAMPALGLIPATTQDVAKDKVENLAGHVAFGATTEVVRRAARYYMEQH